MMTMIIVLYYNSVLVFLVEREKRKGTRQSDHTAERKDERTFVVKEWYFCGWCHPSC